MQKRKRKVLACLLVVAVMIVVVGVSVGVYLKINANAGHQVSRVHVQNHRPPRAVYDALVKRLRDPESNKFGTLRTFYYSYASDYEKRKLSKNWVGTSLADNPWHIEFRLVDGEGESIWPGNWDREQPCELVVSLADNRAIVELSESQCSSVMDFFFGE